MFFIAIVFSLFGLYEVIRAYNKSLYLIIPSIVIFFTAVLFYFYPEIWILEPISISKGNLPFVENYALSKENSPSFLVVLGTVIGMVVVGGSIPLWWKMFFYYLVLYSFLMFLFFYGLANMATSFTIDNIAVDNSSFLIILGLSCIFLAVPMAILFSWKDVCVEKTLKVAIVLSFVSKGIIILTGLFFMFMLAMGLFELEKGWSLHLIMFFSGGLLLLIALGANFKSLFIEFVKS